MATTQNQSWFQNIFILCFYKELQGNNINLNYDTINNNNVLRLRLGEPIYQLSTKESNCQIIYETTLEDWRVGIKENIKKILRPRMRRTIPWGQLVWTHSSNWFWDLHWTFRTARIARKVLERKIENKSKMKDASWLPLATGFCPARIARKVLERSITVVWYDAGIRTTGFKISVLWSVLFGII